MPETKGRTFDDIAQGFAAKAGNPAKSTCPEDMVVELTLPERKGPVPISPTDKVPMVELSSDQNERNSASLNP